MCPSSRTRSGSSSWVGFLCPLGELNLQQPIEQIVLLRQKEKQGSVKVVFEHIVWLFLTAHEVVASRGLVRGVPLTA